jgi:hypothetical protein
LDGSHTTSNFSATSDGHGGTLITDPPVTSGGSVTTNPEVGSGGGGFPDFASTPSSLGLQWFENMVESVVSDLEGLKTTSGFQQLLNRIEGWGSPGSGSAPSDQTSHHPNFQGSGFAGWQSHIVQTLASFGDGKGGPSQGGPIPPNENGLQGYVVAKNLLHN